MATPSSLVLKTVLPTLRTPGSIPSGERPRASPHPLVSVKRWRHGQVAPRWCAAGMVEAGKRFCLVNGHQHLAELRAALDAEIAGTVTPDVQVEKFIAA